MEIKKYSTNKLGTNSYLLIKNGQAILIDPCVKYADIFVEVDFDLVGVFITHGHFDHIDQLETYLNRGLKFYMHENCYPKLKDPKKNLSVYAEFPLSYNLEGEELIFVGDADELNLLGSKIKIIYTPGHSDCSIMIEIENNIFSGDMLFRNSVGRYDLYSSDYISLLDSISKIQKMENNYKIYPGHGPATSLQFEKENNPFFRY